MFVFALVACDSARTTSSRDTSPGALVRARPYAMHVPAKHEASAPLLVLMHGYGSDHANVETHLCAFRSNVTACVAPS